MSAKRKPDGTKKAVKKRKNSESNYDSDLSDEYPRVGGGGGGGGVGEPSAREVLVEELRPMEKLPEELLGAYDKGPGKLLIAGMVSWEMTGKRDSKGVSKIRPNLFSFHRFTGETFRSAASFCAAAHSVLIDANWKAWTFGRNQMSQLGHNDTTTYDKPTQVADLADFNVIQAACGRNHTLFLTDTGTVYACGDNKSGQCGVANKNPTIPSPTRISYSGPPIIKVGCGAEFSVILDIKGSLHTFGLPEYGQLGHNTDGRYFVNSTKMSFHFELQPRKVLVYMEKNKEGHVLPIENVNIIDFACGNNHTVAIDSKNRAYSWGFGGIGRLGHAEQKDEMVPRLIKFFDSQNRKVMRVFCGSSYSLAITDIGSLYLFGQNKKTGEANMYPKPVQDLAGWNITSVGTGYTSIVISADDSLIAWGASPTYGELGLGDLQKSSSTPKEVTRMEGMKIPLVALGYSHTLLLVNTEHEKTKEKYDNLPEFVV